MSWLRIGSVAGCSICGLHKRGNTLYEKRKKSDSLRSSRWCTKFRNQVILGTVSSLYQQLKAFQEGLHSMEVIKK